MPSNHKITVAIPVYNGEKYILEALQSIVNQTRKVDNIIVSDNQSTDNTVNIVKDFFSKHTNYECLLHQNSTNLGYQKNFNKCMELCKTDYLLLLAADDRLKNNTIEIAANFLDKHPNFAFAGGYADSIDEKGKIIRLHEEQRDHYYKKGEILEFLQNNRLYIIPSAVLLRMKYIRKIGYWDLYLGSDERFWPKVIQQYPFAILDDCLVDRRVHLEQTALVDYATKFNEVIRSLKENLVVASYETTAERKRSTKRLIHKQNSSSSLMMGNMVIKNYKNYFIGLKYLIFSVQQSPSIHSKITMLIKANRIILYGVYQSLKRRIGW